MFSVESDMTINVTRGDSGEIILRAIDLKDNEGEKIYEFQAGEVIRLKVFEKKACENVVLQKDFPIEQATDTVTLYLTESDTRFGDVISKPTDYWYEIELNPFTEPQTIVGYDDDGAKIFRLYPEGNDVEVVPPTEEELGIVDKELSLISQNAIQNQAVARAIVQINTRVEENGVAVGTNAEEINMLTARVNNIASLDEGSTTADAELIDIRLGYDGVTSVNAGTSVRRQFKKFADMFDESINLLENVNVSPPDSYTFDSNGEITTGGAYTTAVFTDMFNVDAGKTYTLLCTPYEIGEYKKDGSFIARRYASKDGIGWIYTPSAECKKIIIITANINETRYAKDFYMFEGIHYTRPEHQGHVYLKNSIIGSENIYPNSINNNVVGYSAIGEENCDFIQTNKDLLRNDVWVDGKAYTIYGVYKDINNYSSIFVRVNPSTTYKLGYYDVLMSVYGFNKNKVPIGDNEAGTITVTSKEFTTPSDCYYIGISALTTTKEQVTLHLSDYDVANPNTFKMDGLRIGVNNLPPEILSAVKTSTSSILADLIFTNETKKIKLIGDSITHGMGSSDFAQSTDEADFLFNVGSFPQYRNYGVKCWAGMLKTYLEDKFNCSVTNNGSSGSKVEHLISNWNSIVDADDDVIICMIGTNDRISTTLSDFYQRLVTVYNMASANNQKVIFVSPPPSTVSKETSQAYKYHMEDVNNVYNYISSSLNVGYIPLYNEFIKHCDHKGITVDSLLADGLHPNDNGYKVVFDIVLEALGFGKKIDGATW